MVDNFRVSKGLHITGQNKTRHLIKKSSDVETIFFVNDISQQSKCRVGDKS